MRNGFYVMLAVNRPVSGFVCFSRCFLLRICWGTVRDVNYRLLFQLGDCASRVRFRRIVTSHSHGQTSTQSSFRCDQSPRTKFNKKTLRVLLSLRSLIWSFIVLSFQVMCFSFAAHIRYQRCSHTFLYKRKAISKRSTRMKLMKFSLEHRRSSVIQRNVLL